MVVIVALPALGADDPTPVEHDFISNYSFRGGETLPQARIHYVTIGSPKNPAVLVLHGTGGSLKNLLSDRFAGELFKPGGVLDASKHFIIIPDNIGHGGSSKPSDGLGRRFPHYDYDDMVDLQHRLVTEGLRIDHLRVVMGTSMGGMHTWMWGERWPGMMDRLVPLASAPAQIAGRNRVWRKMMIDDLERGDLDSALHLLIIAGSAPIEWQKNVPKREAADSWLAEQMKTLRAAYNVDDLLYAVESSRNYDPSPDLERITAPLLAINFGDDFVNPPELGLVDTLIKRVKNGRYLLIPASDRTHGHGTHTWAAVWERDLDAFLKFEQRFVEVNGRKYPYAVAVPRTASREKLPVILFLHGAGERGTDGVRQTEQGIGPVLEKRSPDAIVVMPQVPPDMRWIGDPASAAIKALDAAIAEFNGDPERVALTGLSMGGYGTWHLALAHPQRFIALAPICGGILPPETANSVRQSPLTLGNADPYTFTAHALRAKPIRIFHGGADTVIPVSESRKMAAALRAEGADVQYTEYEGVGHGSWVRAYDEDSLWVFLIGPRA